MTTPEDQNEQTPKRGPLAAGTALSHYRIIRKLDEGGMGEIYLAEDQKLHREVAIKVLRPEFVGNHDRLERFLREARTAAKISHANVMNIFDMGSVEDPQSGKETAYIVLEHVSGETLSEVLEGRQPTMKEALRIAEKTAAGLAAAHKLNIVHRDIKTDNIKFDENGEPKILDFGLAKSIEPFLPSTPDPDDQRNTVSRELTTEGKILGTVTYMSPEQARGDVVDTRSDVFSFGILLYRMFTGRFPFDAPDRVSTLAKIIESRQTTPSNVNEQIPAELDRVIEKCLRKDPDERYQDTRDLVVDLRLLRRQFDSGITESDSFISSGLGRRKKKFRMSSVGAIAVLAAMIVISVLAISYLPTGSNDGGVVQASENRLAIMYFSNLADPEDQQRLGEIVANILITDLSISPDVKVVSSQRLRDVLQLIGENTPRNIDEELASQIARKANTRWMLTGSILQTEPTYVVTAQLVETSTGYVISSHRITGNEGETIFAVVDKLSTKVRDDLSISPAGERASTGIFAASAANATKSKEAYRYYLDGVDAQRQLLHIQAREAFRKATELDSTFALAWYGLSQYMNESDGSSKTIEMAVNHMQNLSPLEQKYILARQQLHSGENDSAEVIYQSIIDEYPDEKWAYYQLGIIYYGTRQMEKAIKLHLKAVQIDPLFKEVYNQLAYEYDRAGNIEKSLWAINKYIDLVPDEANPYDSRGELLALNGQLDQARESFEKAISLNPDFYMSALNLGHIYILDQEYKKAESLFQAYVDHPEKDIRSEVRVFLARIYEYQGQIDRAIRGLKLATESDRLEYGGKSNRVGSHFNKVAALYTYIDDYASAISEVDSAIATYDLDSGLVDGYDGWGERWSAAYKAYMLAMAGKRQYASALMDTVLKAIDTTKLDDMVSYHYVIGRYEFGMGSYDKALKHLKAAAELEPSFIIRYLTGRSNLEIGNTGAAVASLESAVKTYSKNRGYWMAEGVFCHYWLGRAYEASGWDERAAEQYETFLDIFKNADPEVIMIEDARGRLTRLTHGS